MYKYLNKLEYDGKYVHIYYSEIFKDYISDIAKELDRKIPQIISFFAIKKYDDKYQVNLYDNEFDYRNFVQYDLENVHDSINCTATGTKNMYTSYDLLVKQNSSYYLVDMDNGTRRDVTNGFVEYKVGYILEKFIDSICNRYIKIKPNRYWLYVGIRMYLSGINNKSTDTLSFYQQITNLIDMSNYDDSDIYRLVLKNKGKWVELDKLSKEVLEDSHTDPYIYTLCYVCAKYLFNKYSRRNILLLLLDDDYYELRASNNKIIDIIVHSYYDRTLPKDFFFTPRRKNKQSDKQFSSYDEDVNEYNGVEYIDDDLFLIDNEYEEFIRDLEDDDVVDDFDEIDDLNDI